MEFKYDNTYSKMILKEIVYDVNLKSAFRNNESDLSGPLPAGPSV